MLTRKHFEAIAAAIRDARTQPTTDAACDDIMRALATLCKDSNHRFDRDRFVAACNPEETS